MREHVDFVQAQYLPWEDAGPFGFPGARLKLLSEDPATTAFSAVLQLPQGWSRLSTARDRDEEIFGLDGSALVGDAPFTANGYAFIPAGHAENAIRAQMVTTLLYFRSESIEVERRTPEAVARRNVDPVNISEGAWDGDFDKFGLGAFKATARMRVLREDPFTGETTYVSATVAFRRGEKSERHPIVQEFYMLSGELAGEYGVMHAGAYCWRPPMAKHAPYYTPTGAVILFRSLGGKQETYWEPSGPPPVLPEHRPILPERLKPYGQPFDRPKRY